MLDDTNLVGMAKDLKSKLDAKYQETHNDRYAQAAQSLEQALGILADGNPEVSSPDHVSQDQIDFSFDQGSKPVGSYTFGLDQPTTTTAITDMKGYSGCFSYSLDFAPNPVEVRSSGDVLSDDPRREPFPTTEPVVAPGGAPALDDFGSFTYGFDVDGDRLTIVDQRASAQEVNLTPPSVTGPIGSFAYGLDQQDVVVDASPPDHVKVDERANDGGGERRSSLLTTPNSQEDENRRLKALFVGSTSEEEHRRRDFTESEPDHDAPEAAGIQQDQQIENTVDEAAIAGRAVESRAVDIEDQRIDPHEIIEEAGIERTVQDPAEQTDQISDEERPVLTPPDVEIQQAEADPQPSMERPQTFPAFDSFENQGGKAEDEQTTREPLTELRKLAKLDKAPEVPEEKPGVVQRFFSSFSKK